MTIKMPRNLMTAISVVAFAVMLHGCGGGGGSSPVATMDDDTPPTTPPTTIMGQIIPSGTTLTLPPGHGLQEGTLRAKMGQTVTLRDDDGNVIVSGTCTDVDCSADLTGDVVTIDGKVELLEANALVLALLTDLLPPAPTELTALETAQADAATAAAEAATAAEAAKTASDAAQAARQDRAIIQTGDLIPPGETEGKNSGVSADKAYIQAKDAADEAAVAQTASDAAAEATDVVAATRELVKAEDARDDALEAQGLAETHRDAAVMASTGEVKVVEETKSVGDTSITIDGTASSRTVNSVTKHTGLVNATEGVAINTTGTRNANGQPLVWDHDNNPETPDQAGTNVGTGLMPSMAFTYDDRDDNARVTLVHSYLGSAKQMQFLREADANPFVGEGGRTVQDFQEVLYPATDGKISMNPEDGAPSVAENAKRVAPTPAGTFVSAADTDKTAELYYVPAVLVDLENTPDVDESTDITVGDADDGIDQTKIFLERNVDDGVTTYKVVAVVQVTVDNATGFKHLHYGLWNGISGTGVNTVADLGIGFVTAYGEAGMTQDMPNFGSATYNGNWVANVQAEDPQGDGAITREDGTSMLTADFTKGEVDVALVGLATLEGTIDGNTFSGEDIELDDVLPGDLANADDFMGSFSGAFFGPKAAEAGGVFDYSSEDNKNGAFRGSFGGAR